MLSHTDCGGAGWFATLPQVEQDRISLSDAAFALDMLSCECSAHGASILAHAAAHIRAQFDATFQTGGAA